MLGGALGARLVPADAAPLGTWHPPGPAGVGRLPAGRAGNPLVPGRHPPGPSRPGPAPPRTPPRPARPSGLMKGCGESKTEQHGGLESHQPVKYVSLTANDMGNVIDPTAYLDQLPSLAAALPEGARAFATDPDHYDFATKGCTKDLTLERLQTGTDDAGVRMEFRFKHNCWK